MPHVSSAIGRVAALLRPAVYRLFVFTLLVPLLLFAYQGSFSRLMSDDYCAIAVGQELGAWDGMGYWYNSWAGSYANFYFKSAIAGLDTLAPALAPLLIAGLWWLAATFAVGRLFRHLKITVAPWIPAVLLSSAGVVASINALYSPQSFYWFAASTHYTLPLALLTCFCGLPLGIASRRARSRFATTAAFGAVICFISGGASEIFVVFQLSLLTLLVLPLPLFWRNRPLRRSIIVVVAGWLATLAALLLQLNSPGLAIRAAVDAERFGLALREPTVLVARTLELTFEFLGHPPAFAGFVLLVAAGLLATTRLGHIQSNRSSPVISKRQLTSGLVFQLIWMPLLWTHISDDPQFLGRFSGGYLVVLIINLLLLLGFTLLLTQRRRINDHLRGSANSGAAVYAFALVAALALFAMTQLRSIHFRAAAYLFTSAASLLVLAAMRSRADVRDQALRRLNWLSLYSLFVAVACLAAIVFSALFGRGFVDARILAPAVPLLVAPGLFIGAQFGLALGHATPFGVRVITAGCVMVILVISIGITLGRLRLAPDFQNYARAWDARHLRILEQRDSGQREIVAAPLAFDMADYVGVVDLGQDPANRCARRYYGVDSIVVADE